MFSKRINDSSATITGWGTLDVIVAKDLEYEFQSCFEKEVYDITVDLIDAEFVDSAVLAVLTNALKSCRTNNGDLRIIKSSNPAAFRMFELTKLDHIFEISS